MATFSSKVHYRLPFFLCISCWENLVVVSLFTVDSPLLSEYATHSMKEDRKYKQHWQSHRCVIWWTGLEAQLPEENKQRTSPRRRRTFIEECLRWEPLSKKHRNLKEDQISCCLCIYARRNLYTRGRNIY